MIYAGLAATCTTCVIGSSLAIAILLARLRRDRFLASALLMVLDCTLIIVLPLSCLSSVSPSISAVNSYLLATFFFFLVTCASYLLFPSTTRGFLIPLSTLYLCLASSLSVPLLFYTDSHELNLHLFMYRLVDNVTCASFLQVFGAVLIPFCKHTNSKLKAYFDSRFLASKSAGPRFETDYLTGSPVNRIGETSSGATANRLLGKALEALNRGDYRTCVEYCDAEIERIIISKLVRYVPKERIPRSLSEQVSKLHSLGLRLQLEKIIQLRKIRNALTRYSEEATLRHARLAIETLGNVEEATSTIH